MKKLVNLLILLFINTLAFSQASSQWIRYASISPDGKKIAFTYKGDIYAINNHSINIPACR